ncbi:MAG: hypothetical protein AAF394_03880, partial [Planctomycetota bacterium]
LETADMNHSQGFRRSRYMRFPSARSLAVFALSLSLSASTIAQETDEAKKSKVDATSEPLYSGLQPGEKVRAFEVLGFIDGSSKELEIVNKKNKTTVLCFIHRLSTDDRILYGLGLVDFYAKRHKDLTSHIVLLSDERAKIEKMLTNWSKTPLFSNSLLSLSADGSEGPGYYGLNRSVAMTVMVINGDKVVKNLVFNAPNNRDLESIMKAIATAVDAPEPALATIQQELLAERKREMEKRIKASPVFKLAPNEELGRIMFGIVNARGNRMMNAKRRGQQLTDWAGGSEERLTTLKKYCKAVLTGDFSLNQYSRDALKKLAED